MEENNFGEYLTDEYEILRRVFSFLSCVDLESCMQVCNEWRDAAQTTIVRRRKIQWFRVKDRNLKPFILSDALLALSFCSVPQVTDNEANSNFMAKEAMLFVARYGIIAFSRDSKPLLRRNRVELPLMPRPYMRATVRFPEWEGVTIKTVSIDRSQKLKDVEMDALLNIPDDIPVQAMVIIVYDGGYDAANNDLNVHKLVRCVRKGREDFAFGGCRLEIEEESTDEIGIKCILFMGKNVEAASCVLGQDCRTACQIQSTIVEFSKNFENPDHHVMIIFRCFDRQKVRRHYKFKPKENVETWETHSIKANFPSCSAVGCYAVGEFGWNETALTPKQRVDGRIPDRNYELGYSTVLVCIGFKK